MVQAVEAAHFSTSKLWWNSSCKAVRINWWLQDYPQISNSEWAKSILPRLTETQSLALAQTPRPRSTHSVSAQSQTCRKTSREAWRRQMSMMGLKTSETFTVNQGAISWMTLVRMLTITRVKLVDTSELSITVTCPQPGRSTIYTRSLIIAHTRRLSQSSIRKRPVGTI